MAALNEPATCLQKLEAFSLFSMHVGHLRKSQPTSNKCIPALNSNQRLSVLCNNHTLSSTLDDLWLTIGNSNSSGKEIHV